MLLGVHLMWSIEGFFSLSFHFSRWYSIYLSYFNQDILRFGCLLWLTYTFTKYFSTDIYHFPFIHKSVSYLGTCIGVSSLTEYQQGQHPHFSLRDLEMSTQRSLMTGPSCLSTSGERKQLELGGLLWPMLEQDKFITQVSVFFCLSLAVKEMVVHFLWWKMDE